jgi:hypothetical protein
MGLFSGCCGWGGKCICGGGGTLLWIEIWHFWLLERVELDIDEVHKKGGKKKKKKKRQKRDEK